MSTIHHLKTLPTYFDAVERGEKTFEIRRDDRGFQKGDIVRLLRLPESGERVYALKNDPTYGLENIDRRILWILTGGQFGLEPGYVILALGYLSDDEVAEAQS
ncbi:DUF3850 domain-containing protein [Methylobacterium fujisawaense]|uniref:DUF3850 domain-containing protein n=1 Tax=Methylobacterium fujisawaense TaxID=107400 RepID=UPI00313BEA76